MRVIAERDLERSGAGESLVARRALRASIDALVVVGAAGAEEIDRRKVPVIHVRGPEDLRAHWFLACRTVALFGARCSLPDQVDAVRRKLEAMA